MPNDSTIAPYALPAYPLQRVRYYNGEFLKEAEFVTDQQYHIDRKQRHDRLLHVAGIAEGLAVAIGPGGTAVTVAPGTAVDDQGRQILLPPSAGSTTVAQTFTVDSTWGATMILEIAFFEMDDVLADSNSAISDYTRFTQSSVVMLRDPSVNPTPSPNAVYLALVTTNAPGTPTIATGVSTAGRAYAGVSLPGPANASTTAGSLRSQGDAYPGWAQLGCSLNVAASGSFGAPALPTAGGSYTLSVGDVAAAGKVLAGNLSGLPAAPPTLYVGGSASVTGASSLGAPALPTGGGSYTLSAGDLAASGKALIGTLSGLPAAPPTLYVGGSASVTGASSLGAPALPTGGGSYALGAGDMAASGKALIGTLSALPSAPPTLYVGGAATVTGNATLGSPSLPSGFTPASGDLAAAGKAYIAGALTVGATTSAHTVSGSIALGAPSLPGGFAPLVNGDLAVAGRAYVAGALTAGASTSAHSVSGSVALGAPSLPGGFAPLVNGDLAAAGRAYVAGTLTVGGASNLGGNLFANGNDIYLGAGSSTTSGLVYNSQFDGPFAFGNTGGALGGVKSGTRFRSSAQYVQLPTMPLNSGATGGPNFPAGFSCAAWIYLYSLDNWARILDLGAGQQNDNICFGVLQNGGLAFETYQGATAGTTVTTPPGTLALNQWIHVAVTMDGSGNVTLYKNGVALATGVTLALRNVARASNYIGKSNWASDPYFNAILSQVSLWSGVHPPTNLSGTLAGTEAGLVGYYKLTDVSGTSAPDSTSASQPNRIGNATVGGAAALSSASTTALVWDGAENVVVGYGGGNLTVQGSAAVGTWTSTSSTSPVPPPTALSVYGTLSFPGLIPADPPATITQRWIPAGQYPSVGGVSDTTNTTERSELILYAGNDVPGASGPDLITLRAPAIRLQTYNNASVGDITNAAGSNDRVYIDVNGNVGMGTVVPAYPLDVAGMARVCSGSNPILFSSGWQSSTSSTHAEISNDTGGYKALMIVGNSSSGARTVGVWDNLTVAGALGVTGAASVGTTFSVGGNATLGNNNANAHVFNGGITVTQSAVVGTSLSVQGNATLGSGSGNNHTVYGNVSVPNDNLFLGSSTRQMINLYGTGYGIGVQGGTAYFRTGTNFGWYLNGSHSSNSLDPGPGGTSLMTLDSTGALSVSGKLNVLNDNLSFGSTTRQMINLFATAYGIGVQGSTAYFRTGGNFGWYLNGTHANGQLDPGSGGTSLMTLDTSGHLTVGTWTSTNAASPVAPPVALTVLGMLSFPGLNGTDPPATITQRWIPAGQYPADGGGTNERSELILYNGNDGPDGAGPDLITLRAPAIRLQTYNSGVADITNASGSNDRLYVDGNGNVGIGTVIPQYLLDVGGAARISGNLTVGPNNVVQCRQEILRFVRGVVGSDGSIVAGQGFTVTHVANGRFTVVFTPAFAGMPAVTLIQIYNGNLSGGAASVNDVGYTSGSSRDNAVIEGILSSQFSIKTGDAGDNWTDRAFAFLAMGP